MPSRRGLAPPAQAGHHEPTARTQAALAGRGDATAPAAARPGLAVAAQVRLAALGALAEPQVPTATNAEYHGVPSQREPGASCEAPARGIAFLRSLAWMGQGLS